jgi:HPt (histidine-containing phosphotransfer) domain-containing protein
MQEELRALIARHCGTIAGKVESLSGIVTGLARGGAHAGEQIVTAIALAHEIRGSAGSIGFRDVFKAATALEDSLKVLSKAGGAADNTVDRMNALADIALNLRPESSSLFDADLSGLARH